MNAKKIGPIDMIVGRNHEDFVDRSGREAAGLWMHGSDQHPNQAGHLIMAPRISALLAATG